MSAKKTAIEVYKFGGASLADGGAYRHAVGIVKGRPGAPVVVVSAPGGITDALLGLATRAVAGKRGAKIDADVASLRARYHTILRETLEGFRTSRDGVGQAKPGLQPILQTTSAVKSARTRAASRRYRAGAAGRSSGSDPRSSPSTGRSIQPCAPPQTER